MSNKLLPELEIGLAALLTLKTVAQAAAYLGVAGHIVDPIDPVLYIAVITLLLSDALRRLRQEDE